MAVNGSPMQIPFGMIGIVELIGMVEMVEKPGMKGVIGTVEMANTRIKEKEIQKKGEVR